MENNNNGTEYRKYSISKNEMNRRKNAFIKLTVSFYICYCIFLLDLIMLSPLFFVPFFIFLAVIIIYLIYTTNRIMIKQSNWNIYLSNKELDWDFGNINEKYSFKNIKSIRIKRTCKGLIREMKFEMSGTKNIFINGLINGLYDFEDDGVDNFENFKKGVTDSVENVPITDYKESSIDFDHPLFYVVLGSVLGITSSMVLRLLLSFNEISINYFQLILAASSVILGIYFLISQPIKSRYGDKSKKGDFVWGSFFFGMGILIIILLGIFK